MKRCPQCKTDYFDESMDFCLDDGSRLSKIDGANNETLTLNSIKPISDILQNKTVQMNRLPDTEKAVEITSPNKPVQSFTEKKEVIKKNVSDTTQKILEISPIVFALSHNYWQWLYLYRESISQFSVFLTSYNFLVWLFLLFGGATLGLFSIKYGKNKGFAITSLVVLAINVILSLVPK